MAGFTDAFEAAILNHFFGATALAAPPTGYEVALYTVAPADDGTGGTEATYTGYARLAVTNNVTEFPAASGTAPTRKTNGNDWVFGEKTDAGTQVLVAWALIDNADSITIVQHGALSPNLSVAQNDTPRIPASQLKIEAGDTGDVYGA